MYFSTHNHTEYSNVKLLDAITRPDEIVNYAHEIGLAGICISEHAVLSSHLKVLNAYKKLKETGNMREDFKVGLGVEAYLCVEPTLEELKEKATNRETKFYHFLMIALNERGHEQLRILSSKSWENSFMLYGQQRTPNLMSEVEKAIKKGDVVASSSCLGGYIPTTLLKMYNAKTEEEKEKYKKDLDWFTDWCIKVFGEDNFYLEIQPSDNEEQKIANRLLVSYAKHKGLKNTIASDTHYLKKEDRPIHEIYLKSGGDTDREVADFYSSTYLFSEKEAYDSLVGYLSHEDIQAAFDGTIDIHEKVEMYELEHPTIIPMVDMPKYTFEHKLETVYHKFPYVKEFAYSDYEIDRYYLYLIQEGLFEKVIQKGYDEKTVEVYMDRINTELKEIWLISEKLNERLSSYYVLTRDVVQTIWEEGDSIVGVARGSSSGFLTNYLIDITQIDPIPHGLLHFRHITVDRPELPDIDLDSENAKRDKILEALKNKYGHKRVLNIATFMTSGSRSILLSVGRGMGIDNDEISYLTGLIPNERGFNWGLKDCFFGNEAKGRKPITELVNAVEKYEGMKEAALKLEGLIKGCSVHASGVYIFNDDYTKHNAMMKSSSGQEITMFDSFDSDAQSALKVDMLTVKNIDRLRIALDFIVKLGLVEDKGSLKANYDAYLYPDKIDYENPKIWERFANNEVADLFQFDTPVGLQCVKKAKPTNIAELSAANNLMRLMSDKKEQPIDKYVRYKNNIEEWYDDMREFGLTEEEIEIMKEEIGYSHGLISAQEEMMLLMMSPRIAGFSVKEANEARRVVSKKKMDQIQALKEKFFRKGLGEDE